MKRQICLVCAILLALAFASAPAAAASAEFPLSQDGASRENGMEELSFEVGQQADKADSHEADTAPASGLEAPDAGITVTEKKSVFSLTEIPGKYRGDVEHKGTVEHLILISNKIAKTN